MNKEALLSNLQTGNDRQRRAASYRLIKLKDPSTVPHLINALNDKDQSVQRNVRSALKEIGTEEALEALKKAKIQANEVHIPYDGRQILFPQQCVYCLAPASDVQSLEITEHYSEHLGSKIVTHTLKLSINIPYCAEHAQYSTTIQRISNTLVTISVIVGLVVGVGILGYLLSDGRDTESAFTGFLVFAIIGGGITWVSLKQIAKMKYPIVRQFGTLRKNKALGVNGGIKIRFEDQKPRISAIKLRFDNPEYTRMFTDVNKLTPDNSF